MAYRPRYTHRLGLLVVAVLAAAYLLRPVPAGQPPRTILNITAPLVRSLLFVGDTGDIRDSVLELLRAEASRAPGITTVLLLGDNVYPRGIPPDDAPDYEESKRRLNDQLSLLQETGAQAIFVPGNHDWNDNRAGGWEAVMRQEQLVTEVLGPHAYAPHGGCPGPAMALSDEHFQIIALNTQWYLTNERKPGAAECGISSSAELPSALERLSSLRKPGAQTVLIKHHPLESVGAHGRSSECPHALDCPRYAALRRLLIEALDRIRPLICAAGHDHSLQVLRGERGCDYFLVSGSGSKLSGVRADERTLDARSEPGLLRLDKHEGGTMVLSVVIPGKKGEAGRIVFQEELQSAAHPRAADSAG